MISGVVYLLRIFKMFHGLMNDPVYNKPTRCNSDSVVFINNYKYALHVSDALCVHLQEHYKLQQHILTVE